MMGQFLRTLKSRGLSFLPLSLSCNLLVIFQIILFFSQSANALDGALVGCREKSSQLKKIWLQGKVILNESLLPPQPEQREKIYEEAVELQIKHLIGYFRTTKSDGLNANISSFRKNLRWGKPTSVKYGATIYVEDYTLPIRSIIGQAPPTYLQEAIKKINLSSSDPALSLPYEVELILADCSSQDALNTHPIYLPVDPYMSLFLENKEQRYSRKFNNAELPSVSSCQASEIVEFGQAKRGWFFWSPVEEKISADNKKRTCLAVKDPAKTYKPEIHVLETLSESSELTPDLLLPGTSKNAELKFYGVFGIISRKDYYKPVDIPTYRKTLWEVVKICQTSKNIPECFTAWDKVLIPPKTEKPYEPGIFNFLFFMKELRAVAKIISIKEIKTKEPETEIRVQIKSKLLDSNVPLELNLYFGTTTLDYEPPVKTKGYAEFLSESLSQADAMSYLGHSGLGYNVSLAEYSKLWNQFGVKPPSRTKPLWLGIYNCEGFSYFGFDLKPLFKNKSFNLFLLSSTGVEAEARLPLAQVSALDKMYSKKALKIQDFSGKYIWTKDFYVLLYLTDFDLNF